MLCGVAASKINMVDKHNLVVQVICSDYDEWEFASLYTHLGNSTGCRTVAAAAPLLLSSGPTRYVAVLHG